MRDCSRAGNRKHSLDLTLDPCIRSILQWDKWGCAVQTDYQGFPQKWNKQPWDAVMAVTTEPCENVFRAWEHDKSMGDLSTYQPDETYTRFNVLNTLISMTLTHVWPIDGMAQWLHNYKCVIDTYILGLHSSEHPKLLY
jgi:hypothetical protein